MATVRTPFPTKRWTTSGQRFNRAAVVASE